MSVTSILSLYNFIDGVLPHHTTYNSSMINGNWVTASESTRVRTTPPLLASHVINIHSLGCICKHGEAKKSVKTQENLVPQSIHSTLLQKSLWNHPPAFPSRFKARVVEDTVWPRVTLTKLAATRKKGSCSQDLNCRVSLLRL